MQMSCIHSLINVVSEIMLYIGEVIADASFIKLCRLR
jgi:hypothetical protein